MQAAGRRLQGGGCGEEAGGRRLRGGGWGAEAQNDHTGGRGAGAWLSPTQHSPHQGHAQGKKPAGAGRQGALT